MKVVLDCNVLISAGLNTGTCRDVFAAIIHSHQCILSKDILGEYVSVARRKHFAKAAANLLDLIRLVSQKPYLLHRLLLPYGCLIPKTRSTWMRRWPRKPTCSSPATKNTFPKPPTRAYRSFRRGSFWP